MRIYDRYIAEPGGEMNPIIELAAAMGMSAYVYHNGKKFFKNSSAHTSKRFDDEVEKRVEERLVRHYELSRAAGGESDLRLARGHLVPERSAPYALPSLESRVGVAPEADLARVRPSGRPGPVLG